MRARVWASFVVIALAAACDATYTLAGDAVDGGTDGGPSATDGGSGADSSDAGTLVDAESADAADAAPRFPLTLGAQLRLWLDATDTTTVTLDDAGAATVAAWSDKSGRGLVATTTLSGSGHATYAVDSDAGGVHAISLGSAYLSIPDSPALEFTKETFSVFAVVRYAKADLAANYNTVVSKSSLSNAAGYQLVIPNGGTQICAAYAASFTSCGTVVEGFGIFALQATAGVEGGTGSLVGGQLGQTAGTATTADNTADTAPFVVGGVEQAYFFTASFYEILVVDQPTTDQSAQIVTYLQTKYGRP